MVIRTSFGEWLRQRRHLLDLTQAELAALCNCAPVTVRKWEAGERRPSRELALALAAVLRVPARERSAFVQFARSDDVEASFHLPAWEPKQPSWRSDQLPPAGPKAAAEAAGLFLEYDLVAPDAPKYEQVEDGRFLVEVRATGPVTGDIEGKMALRITQIIQPKPPDVSYAQALPMQIAALFKIESGNDLLEGTYTGSLAPMLDDGGNGHAREQGTGQVLFVSPGFIDLFLNYVFVESEVRMVEGTGTGASGIMHMKPPS